MRKLLKFVHVIGAAGMIGALAALLVLLSFVPEPASLGEYARLRASMGAIAQWILLPSIALVLFGGLMAMAWNSAYHNAGWAWFKLATGILVFEGTLSAIQGPIQKQAEIAAQALAGEIDPALIKNTIQAETSSIWILLGVALVNVVLGVWRPRSRRKQTAASAAGAADGR